MSEEHQKPLIDEMLCRLGVSSDFAQKVRFRGPVGKLALVAVFCILCLGAVAVRTNSPTVQGMCAAFAVVVALAIAAGILWYSDKHPEQATLEGMEVVVLQQQKYLAEAAAKGIAPVPPEAQMVLPDPAKNGPEFE